MALSPVTRPGPYEIAGQATHATLERQVVVRPLPYDASPEIRAVLARIGRTEDIKFSPDDSRLAVAEFQAHRISLFSIRLDRRAATPRIAILGYSALSSPSLRNPHGVDFLDNEHIVVSNRTGDLVVLRVPAPGQDWGEREVQPVTTIKGRRVPLPPVQSPGSVAGYDIGNGRYRVLVCNNNWHVVTSHVVTIGDSRRTRHDGPLIEHALRIPDGVSVSADHAWIAVSNHADGEVLLYRNTPRLDRTTPAAAVLRGMVCPHGVCLAPDGRSVFVADAASQYLHVFETTRDDWEGTYDPASIRLLDDATFYAGRHDAGEGGVKGVDIDSSGGVLATTHKHGVLGFYDVTAVLAAPTRVDAGEMAELCRQRDRSIEHRKARVLTQQWTVPQRIRHAVTPAVVWTRYTNAADSGARMCRLYYRNRWSRETLLDPSGPVVSLTTHGLRLRLAFFAIESIGLGSRKPSRIVLWLDAQAYANRPDTLRRLESRGLEIRVSDDFGPHTKYHPYVDREDAFAGPLVTADDDVLYPRWWLQRLLEAYEANPSAIHCHRARRMGVARQRLVPYGAWNLCVGTSPSHLNLITGVSGAIYPPPFLQHLKRQGRRFERCCPANDDIWMTVNALREDVKVAQVADIPGEFPAILGSQRQALFQKNVIEGDNQRQLTLTFSDSDLAKLATQLA